MVNVRKLNQANIYLKHKDYKSAEKIFYELLHDYPTSSVVLSFWGYYNLKIGRLKKAETILDRAYNLRKTASTISALAYIKQKFGKFDDAIILYEELLRFDKNNESIYRNIIDCFDALNMRMFMDAYIKKFLSIFSEKESAYDYVTNKYIHCGLYKTAEEYCAIGLQKFPQSSPLWVEAGLLQEALYNNEDCARECYISAIDNGNDYGFGYYHLAVSFEKSGDFKKAEELFLKALNETSINDKAIIECSLGLLYLKEHRFEEGYEHYLKREVFYKEFYEYNNLSSEKLWNTQNLKFDKDNKIYVFSDQGLGDVIMFSRYLPYLYKEHKNLTMGVKSSLESIMKRSFPNIDIVPYDTKLEPYDNVIVLSDLPAYLKMDFKDIPSSNGYLVVDKEKQKQFKEKYFNNDKLKVGLCWKAGSMAMRDHIKRTINIDYFKSMFEKFKDNDKIQFYAVQKEDIFDGVKKYPEIIDLSEELETFDDTAAMAKNLDMLITVDTSVLHIAGAVGGVDTIALIPYCADWRWFECSSNTDWYSSVRLIKQQGRQDWFVEVDKIIEILQEKLETL